MTDLVRTKSDIFQNAITPRLGDACATVPAGATKASARNLSDRVASPICALQLWVMRASWLT
jgi:hypothetical protein